MKLTQLIMAGMFSLSSISGLNLAQADESKTEIMVISDKVIQRARIASEASGLPIALVKIDTFGNPIVGEQTAVVASSKLTEAQSTSDQNSNTSKFTGDISFVVGLPSALGVRAELQTLKGTLGLGVEGSTFLGSAFTAAVLVDITPLAAKGIKNFYAGYRFYGIKPTMDESTIDSARISAFVGGFRFRKFFIEAGNGHLRKFRGDCTCEDERQWIGTFGFAVNSFGKR